MLDVAFAAWLLYMFVMTAFVGVVAGVILALLWSVRLGLGLAALPGWGSRGWRDAARAFVLVVAGILIGAAVVIAALSVPYVAIVWATEAFFGDDPPTWVVVSGFGLLLCTYLFVARHFAQAWQRRVRAQLGTTPS